MKNAVIYARFSSHAQNEQSIEGQLKECRAFAERNNLRIVREYIDRALTGTNIPLLAPIVCMAIRSDSTCAFVTGLKEPVKTMILYILSPYFGIGDDKSLLNSIA